jgi:hypothetical protein
MRRFLTRVDLGSTWAKLSITVERSDGGIVDAEIIRPHSWILESGLCAGRMLPLNLPELEVSGLAFVTAIDDCPPIADGEGSDGVGEHVALVVEVILAPLKLSTDYSPLLPKQSKIASPGIAYGSGMKNQAIRVPRSLLGVSNLGIVSKDD